MTAVTRDDLLKMQPRKVEKVPLPELGNGHYVNVVGFTSRERAAFEMSLQGERGKPSKSKMAQVRERLVASTCQDDDGNKLFDENDLETLGNLNAAVVSRIADAAMRVCGIGESDVEEMAGN